MKVGLFFGTFDPIHNGHLKIVNEVHKSGLVKKILFIVTPQSPFKVNNAITSFNHRVNMLNLAISDIPNLNYSDVELNLKYPQFTSNTLRFLKKKYPYNSYVLILGLDNYHSLQNRQWKDSDYIMNNFEILVFNRKITKNQSNLSKNTSKEFRKYHHFLNHDLINISSTAIRNFFRKQTNNKTYNNFSGHKYSEIKSMLPKAVLNYIETHELYK